MLETVPYCTDPKQTRNQLRSYASEKRGMLEATQVLPEMQLDSVNS